MKYVYNETLLRTYLCMLQFLTDIENRKLFISDMVKFLRLNSRNRSIEEKTNRENKNKFVKHF